MGRPSLGGLLKGKTPLVPPCEGGDARAVVLLTDRNQVPSLEGRDREGLAVAWAQWAE